VIIAGPNGSGKSTCAVTLLPPGMPFVNADMIAAELSGVPGTSADINAGRLLLDRVGKLEQAREDFAFETTLATRMLRDRITAWQGGGYHVNLLFFWLPSADMAVQRVAARVRSGGHNVPESTVRRRYVSGLRNLFGLYLPIVDTWRMYDNSRGLDPQLIAKGTRTGPTKIARSDVWEPLAARRGAALR
jgi:predicted ABC-type ATPase